MRRNALKEKTANMFLSCDAKARYQSKGFVFGAFMSPTHHFYNYTGNGLTPPNIRLTPLLWFPVCVLTMLNDDY